MIKFIICLNSFKYSQSINVWAYIMFAISINLLAMGNGLIKFNGLNYTDWFEQIQFQLGVMDSDLGIVSKNSIAITKTSTEADRSIYEAQEQSNRLSLSLMRMTMAENVKPVMPKKLRNTPNWIYLISLLQGT